MEHGAEIIEFFQPLENEKNLFIANIITKRPGEEENISYALHEAFSKFGLVYEIQVVQSKVRTNVQGNHSFKSDGTTSVLSPDCQTVKTEDNKGKFPIHESKVISDAGARCLWHAFVKFYSSKSALEAKRALHLTLIVGSEICKVNFAKRKKTLKLKQELQVRQCQDLASFYLGFHGWSCCVRALKGEVTKLTAPEDTYRCRFLCVVDLIFRTNGSQTTALGLSEETYMPQEADTFGNVFARCKKRAYQDAVRKAFSNVLLVILSSGKVYPEINTDRQEVLTGEASADILSLSILSSEADYS